ncbi:putative stress associated endoplasmic reticulum protein (serp1/ramp4) [Schistosoma mansoni]|uniref:Putative stress associated endoplasmic reticulum protein (Serp1/ramp4) n=1 Tax=Schistosoma mansoni TaxID=6183 RepID=G4V5T6_SCHMA|nr:putative stress associated endoplasmic reticulum protein (serp1/ramp4) [Schistosoma mansoni]|eukprot:XP_018647525.1 putative stress associated endoplasmic reticulum protein (serp1/ramp4) [Schistosoma mansoni]
MSASQRMKVQNGKAHGNVVNRGNVPKSLKSSDSQSNMNTCILGLIVFVVCGSAIFEIIQHIRMAF